ncbi:MAG: cbb3-type cytochrome c oxidase subunit I, partial [Gammaproteobacteria bacterium]|nr:cbb3-type cytochrome c oxidase subunit I [Gammaproteobacteria bacterium]MDH5594139.1 cbb3-type cytochrome c oxidase subunit I [Gammaproteobacteria bacterium]
HFHYVMAVAGTFSIFGGVYYLYPKMTGRMYNEFIGKIGFWITFIGVNTVFMPMMISGIDTGMPRRYWDYSQIAGMDGYQHIMSIGAGFIFVGFLFTLINWLQGLFKGEKVGRNPWGSRSLEWTHCDSPPGHGNFDPIPNLPEEWSPYAYGSHK